MSGKLYVIGTPIGNMKDITLRAIETLSKVEVLVCEDSRNASKLVNHYQKLGMIERRPRYIPYNEFNESSVYTKIRELIEAGSTVALVSDAGMPAISDPGYRIIRECYDKGLEVEVIPGVSTVTTALSASGIGGDSFIFLGFLPKKQGKRQSTLEKTRETLESVAGMRIVIFLSPHKAVREIGEIKEVLGDRRVVLMREMTKIFEERVEASLSELLERATAKKYKGEMVLVIGA